MPATIMRIIGGPSRPDRAASAPGTPAEREPNMTEKFTMFGPGRTWHRARSSLNASGASQRRSSTITRRDHASTPPKPQNAILAKARKSCGTVGDETRGDVKAGSDVASCGDTRGRWGSLARSRRHRRRSASAAQFSIAPVRHRDHLQPDDLEWPDTGYAPHHFIIDALPVFSTFSWSCLDCAFLRDPSMTKMVAIHEITKLAKNSVRNTMRLIADDVCFS